jgi:chromosome segregation ATPase
VLQDPFGVVKSTTTDRTAAFTLALSVAEPSPSVKKVLDQWREKHQAIASLEAQQDQLGKRIDEITSDHVRIGTTLAKLPQDSDLYRKYVTMLTQQEEELQKLREKRTMLTATIEAKVEELAKFLLEAEAE